MAGKVLVGGTAYSITGGKACVGGTAYTINGGKTLIGGTAYSIPVQTEPKEYTVADLLSRINLIAIAGRNANPSGEVQMTISTNGTYFLFVFCYLHIGIYKVVKSSSISTTRIQNTGTNYCNVNVVDSTHIRYMGESGSYNVYGATMALVQFRGYTVDEANTILSGATLSALAGKNGSQPSNVYLSASNARNKILAVATNTNVAFSKAPSSASGTIELLYGNNTTNPTLTRLVSSNYYLSLNGTSNASVYGGTMSTIV